LKDINESNKFSTPVISQNTNKQIGNIMLTFCLENLLHSTINKNKSHKESVKKFSRYHSSLKRNNLPTSLDLNIKNETTAFLDG